MKYTIAKGGTMKFKVYLISIIIAFSGGVMADKKEVIQKLEVLKKILNQDKVKKDVLELFSEIEKKTKGDVPKEVKQLLIEQSSLPQDYDLLFLGYSLINTEDIVKHYSERKDKEFFFAAYEADEAFNISEEQHILINTDQNEELNDPIKVHNLASFLPLFSFQGDYIVVNLKPGGTTGELVIITDGYEADILAPSLSEHVEDLLIGLANDRYHFSDGELIFPATWFERQKVQKGELLISLDGELE